MPFSETFVPLFLLAGGEVVLAALALRVLLWVVRGWRGFAWRDPAPPDPDGPGGKPVLRVLEGRGEHRPDAAPLQRAA